MAGIDDAEYQRLTEAVRATEKLAAENPNFRSDAGAALLLASKARIEVLEHQVIGVDSEEKKEKRITESAAIIALLEIETRLSSKEKESYAQFLEKNFFTKKDFKDLEAFYASSYDKLSEHGKAQMSERVLEGIRRGEFSMEDLPENVQEATQEFVKGKDGKSDREIFSKELFEKQPQGVSQAATEHSEVAASAKKFAKDDSEEAQPKASSNSDLSKLEKISPTDLSSQKKPDFLSP